jgi:hypothetical protein
MLTVISLAGAASAIAGYLSAKFFAGAETGAKGKFGNLRVKVKDRVVHVHHWLYASFLMMGFHHYFTIHPWPHEAICYGFLIGVIVQGLTYRDFYRVVYKYKKTDLVACTDENGNLLMDY